MQREEALDKIAWHYLKKIGTEEATELIIEFFNEPLKPSLRELLNVTAIMQWETHEPPSDLKPGNPIYRPILLDRMKRHYRGATNEYLAKHLGTVVGINVGKIEGSPPDWLACPVCNYNTFETIGAWDTCPVCGWNSDPVQELMQDDPTGANGISLNDARKNYQTLGAITQEKLAELETEDKGKYPKAS